MAERLILAFDTSGPHCAAALLRGGKVVAAREEPMTRGQAERLMPVLEALLSEGRAAWSDLDAIGVGIGPGNFTGTRIAVAAARGLALGLGIPAEGVGTVEALAAGRDVTVCLPAPRGQVHLGWRDTIETRTPGDALPDGWPAALTGPAAGTMAPGTVPAPSEPVAIAIARVAATRAAPGRARPAPIYLRPADAAPPSDPPPILI
ncbi:tRNA (adenosine(37)-N6)-threonylcarbamoyltransferase complex dimerization subunit type 1 TsaB [uncultured Jannaschia sp.]|uniref:tRNA (adenosine(37)-N6)-threonylcarbamoyltransferase complex dimerization subunit type 1 TsaB n=1 Tax=uncultured Jannaschia sp. TaxID=293347 RepID=UPI00260D0E05|nr:tRNA (adenosine(37)-N6)-threonylcarbamoyltransferase complex dimerization subunit type 1 TsaB [uncultured Jannaschia sp.]